MSPVQEGQILAGKYRIERVLGVGGMGVVVAALHLSLEERVAIKFLLPEALSNPEAVARFAREARAAVKIKSEHVARVTDVGTLETGAPYMVMEFLHGQDLAAILHQQGALPFADAVDFVLQACEALAEAHALGIVHRDLKPANLFLTRRADGSPCIKVLDFGISKVTSPSSSGPDFAMTKTQAVMGSPLYMSPEQLSSSRDVDGRTDVWAMGTILYELVTGRVPFSADTMPQLCTMILTQPPSPPRNLRPDLPEALQQVIVRSLEKDRARRFANVGEFAGALVPFGGRGAGRSAERASKVLSAAGISSGRVVAAAISAPLPEASTQSAWGQTGAPRGRPMLWGSVALVALGLAAGAVWLLKRPDAGTPVAAETTSASTAAVPPAPASVTTPPASAEPSAQGTASAPAVASTPSTASANATPSLKPAQAKAKPKTKPIAPATVATPPKPHAFDPLGDRR